MGERKTRGQSSGCSFALHKVIAVASRMDKSLSFSLMRTSISVKWNITNFRIGGGHMEMEKNKKNRYGFDFTPIGIR